MVGGISAPTHRGDILSPKPYTLPHVHPPHGRLNLPHGLGYKILPCHALNGSRCWVPCSLSSGRSSVWLCQGQSSGQSGACSPDLRHASQSSIFHALAFFPGLSSTCASRKTSGRCAAGAGRTGWLDGFAVPAPAPCFAIPLAPLGDDPLRGLCRMPLGGFAYNLSNVHTSSHPLD